MSTGDFYQLLCVNDRSLLYSIDFCQTANEVAGRQLWEKINYFKELKFNFRIKSATDIFYNEFLNKVRMGSISQDDLLQINGSCVQISINEALQNTINDTKTIWLAPTKKGVKQINEINKRLLKNKKIAVADKLYNNLSIDIICKHTINNSINVTKNESKQLFKISEAKSDSDRKIPPPILSLSIGSRVKVIENIATSIGNYNIILFVIKVL